MSKIAQDIILRPIITEESMLGTADKKYTFSVAKVEVKSVNTVNCRGKKRRYGRFEGYTSSWKKAIVTLTEDSKTIEFFDGMM